ncbi:MAG: ATP-binding cassette domain-containing protein [Dehalococcoidia bacterium]
MPMSDRPGGSDTLAIRDAGIVCHDLTKVYGGAPPTGGWAGGPPGGRPNGGPPPGAPRKADQSVRAVDALTLVVKRGEFFGLLGPNGAGKSTTIGMLTTRVIPTSGQAFVDGIDVVKRPALARTRLASVTQTITLDRSLTVFDNLYFHGRYFGLSRGESRRRAQAMIERFNLDDKAHAMVDALSGGLAQRLQIARALLHEPAVLFLDEPTAGLDPQARLALWDLAREMTRSGRTILLTTHDMEEADVLCERIAVIDHGKLLALDAPARLKATVGAQRIVTVTLGRADDGAARTRIERIAAVNRVDADGRTLRVYADVEQGLVPAVVNAVSDAGEELRDLSVSEPTLEAVYLKLTGREYRV